MIAPFAWLAAGAAILVRLCTSAKMPSGGLAMPIVP
jgi:hypothetical protein